jgi:hypothetical protein
LKTGILSGILRQWKENTRRLKQQYSSFTGECGNAFLDMRKEGAISRNPPGRGEEEEEEEGKGLGEGTLVAHT